MHTKITTAIGAWVVFASAALGTDSSVPHINADQVHALGFDGFGVTVAVIDWGIDYGHPGPCPGAFIPWYGVSGDKFRLTYTFV